MRQDIVDYALEVTPGDYKSDRWQAVTQGRDGRGYSSCADLAHYCLEKLGVTDHKWINRAPRWQVGLNITKLVQGATKRGIWIRGGQECDWQQAGNIVLIGDPTGKRADLEHILIVVTDADDEGMCDCAEWGQVDVSGKQCGKIKRRYKVTQGRAVLGYINLDAASEESVLSWDA